MQRRLHIAVSLVAVFLLLKPFDCFSSGGKFTKEAADCCKRGKCRPSTGDDCCKGTLPGGSDMVTGAKALQNHVPVALPVSVNTACMEPVLMHASFDETNAPPGSPPSSRLNLPLLI